MTDKKIFTYNDVLGILDHIKIIMREDGNPITLYEFVTKYQDKFVKERDNLTLIKGTGYVENKWVT